MPLFGQLPEAPMLQNDLTIVQLAVSTTDAIATYRNMRSPTFVEHNAIARPFMEHGTYGLIGFFVLDAGVKVGVPWLLEKRGFRKTAVILRLCGIADNSYGAVYSLSHHRLRR